MPPLHPEYREVFASLQPSLKGWRATVDATTQDRQVRTYIDQCDNLPSIEELDGIKDTKLYKDTEKLLVEAANGKSLVPAEFTKIRDLLIVKITMKTGTRPGPLENAIVKDFQTAKSDDKSKVILVPKHKRSKDGPAMLGLDEELQKQMQVYIEKVRPQFVQKGVDNIFIKEDGEAFNPGTIGRRLTNFFEKCGIKMAHTQVRKLIATRTHEEATPEEDAKVAKMMGHSVTTRQNCYVRAELTKTAAQAMKVVERVLQPSRKKTPKGKTSPQEPNPKPPKMCDPHASDSENSNKSDKEEQEKDQEKPNDGAGKAR